jgi:hypothetical protein
MNIRPPPPPINALVTPLADAATLCPIFGRQEHLKLKNIVSARMFRFLETLYIQSMFLSQHENK